MQIEADPNMTPEEKAKKQMLAALRQFRDRFELARSPTNSSVDVPFYRRPTTARR